MMKNSVDVAVVMGSKSDEPEVQKCVEILDQFSVSHKVFVMSAHRTPKRVAQFASTARSNGYKLIIAAAGLSAALPGVLAAHTTLPVIGVPMSAGSLQGVDALYSIVQMPPGIPVACVGIGNARNAAFLALSILSVSDKTVERALQAHRESYGDA